MMSLASARAQADDGANSCSKLIGVWDGESILWLLGTSVQIAA